MSCTPTEPVEKHDDISVLQDFINNSSGTLLATLDTDSSGVIEPLELGEQTWNDNGRITILNCDSIGLSGRIPESIGDLTELTQLGLKNNNLSGEIPESIGNLTQLTQLSLSKNSLSGTIPDTIGNLKSLWRLDFSNNLLSGTLPRSLSNLSILEVLLADSNNLRSPIPQEICNIYNPNSNFEFSGNQFCPPLPYCIDSPILIGYQNCDTSCGSGNTYLNGYCYSQSDLDVLNSFVINQDSLNMFFDDDSNGVIDHLELGFQEWQSGRLKTLDCYWDTVSCNLSTEFPISIINLDSLEYLDVQQNSLTGNIPETISNLTNLKYLNISYNQLSGSVPDNFCGENSSLNEIIVTNNKLCPCYPDCIEDTGEQDISECINCDVGFTLICDDLPATVSIIEGDSLCFRESNLTVLQAFIDSSLATLPDSLDMSMDADSSGTIEPLELGTQYWKDENLDSLYAQGKGLSGQIPSVLDSLESLQAIWLYNNYFSGQIPESICNLSNLDWDSTGSSSLKSYIYNNQFCPPYPECIAPFVGEQDTTNCSQSGSP